MGSYRVKVLRGSQNYGYLFGGFYNTACSIWGSIFGFHFLNLSYYKSEG